MPKTFGEILYQARKRKGLKANDMAELLQISQATYSKYENNKIKKIPIDLIPKLCALLDMDANQLFLDANETVKESDIPTTKVYYHISKEEIIEQFEACIKKTRELQIAELNQHLDKIKVTDFKITGFEWGGEIRYTINKKDYKSVLGPCVIISVWISEMLKEINKVASSNGGFDEKLARIYVQYMNLLTEILSN